MLYLIGLGLNERSYSREAYETISKSDKIYFDNYTVNFPYGLDKLKKQFKGKKFIEADRNFVESDELIKLAKNKKVSILVYGSPLMATTHISLIEEARKKSIKYKIIHNASIFDAVLESGLQAYKFGKIASIPKHDASSFTKIIKDNLKINAHTLVLVDIGLDLGKALEKISKLNLNKILLCSQIGTKNQKMIYKNIPELKKIKIKMPYCFVIPGKLHFLEKEILESLKNKKI